MASLTSLGIHEPTGLKFAIDQNILPPDPPSGLYRWDTFADHNGEDELFTTQDYVIWSRSGEVGRCLKFGSENESILSALISYFPSREDDTNYNLTPLEPRERQRPRFAKSLVVLLRTQVHIYSFTGGSNTVHIPFEVESVCAAPCGVIIQRKSKWDTNTSVALEFPRVPPNSFILSQTLPLSNGDYSQSFSTASLGHPKQLPSNLSTTIHSVVETPPQNGNHGWPRLVCLTDPMLELGLIAKGSSGKGKATIGSLKTPSGAGFLDPAEEILHVESVSQCWPTCLDDLDSALILAVTVNRETSMYSVWRLSYSHTSDRRVNRDRKSTTNASRRRSSMLPGLTSGTASSVRDSFGGSLAVKKTRKSEKIDPLAKALSLEPDKETEAFIRQSRRASSLLARADLSASHERPLFIDQASAVGGRRLDSFGSQRRRPSSGYVSTTTNWLEAPADGLLDDLDGFHNMALDDPELDCLSREMAFNMIHSVPMDTANIRYSLSDTPASKLCKVFIVNNAAADEQGRNCLLVCIQDTVDKQLQVLTLHTQPNSRKANVGHGVSVNCVQRKTAQNVADSCKIHDGCQSMILVLSEASSGSRQLSIQAPWSGLTSLVISPLTSHNPNNFSLGNGIFESSDTRGVNKAIIGLRNSRGGGIVDLVDEDGQVYKARIQIEPKNNRVQQILNILRSVLPIPLAGELAVGWWHIIQWLGSDTPDAEWTALVIELFVIFIPFIHFDDQPNEGTVTNGLFHDPGPYVRSPAEQWRGSNAWGWVPNTAPIGTASQPASNALQRAIQLSRRYLDWASVSQHEISLLQHLSSKDSVWAIVMSLHLFIEEEKLDRMASVFIEASSPELTVIVCQMTRWLRWHSFADRYSLGLSDPAVVFDTSEMRITLAEPETVPCISEWVRSRSTGQSIDTFLSLKDVCDAVLHSGHEDDMQDGLKWKRCMPRTSMFINYFQISKPMDSSVQVVEALHSCGFTTDILSSLPEGIVAPFQDAISHCQQHPPPHWCKALYELVGRGDVNTVLNDNSLIYDGACNLWAPGSVSHSNIHHTYEVADQIGTQASEEPESEERQAVIHALFKDDKRLYEAESLLSSSKPRVIRLDPQANWSESEYLEQQKELVNTVAINTLATPAGRGMLNYGYRFPLLTQKFSIQGFNLTCVVKPTSVAVGVDKSMFTEEKVNWAFFHQGVAYGLAISPRAKGIDTSWIVFNKPGTDLNHRHAGFLLALGLNGHLKSVAKWVAFKYLTPKHMMTSIGLLLGLSVSHIGTMDSLVTRLLSVHVTRMLPRGAAELNLSHQIQTTGIMGIGVLYYNSQHRRMSEIMVSEIEFMGDEDEEDPLRNEGYRLAAGFALGLINLGKGNNRKGLADMQITEQLLSLASSTKNIELVNVLDRSAAAATIAIGLIFLKTDDAIVARKIDVPSSIVQFDYVRPDILLLRTLAKNLIMWASIGSTLEWIQQSLPIEYRDRYMLDDISTLQSVDLPFFSIIAGLCFAVALRFAGSANTRVRDMLVYYLDRFMVTAQKLPATHFDAQSARSGARMCLDTLALSSAIVMAGTGDLVVMRRLRALHGRDDNHTTYGSHFAAHLAIGALFLGSGTTTFGNSDLCVAALLIAFYPIFPTSIQDNGSHLQAFRHFWVLATEPRCLVTKDLSTGQPISIPIIIHLKPAALSTTDATESCHTTMIRRETPCLLPPLDDIIMVRTDASVQGFWDLEMNFDRNPALKDAFYSDQNLFLRRRPAHATVFTSTLQTLGHGLRSETASDPKHNFGFIVSHDSESLSWLFSLARFKSLSRVDRARVLGWPGMSEDGNTLSLNSRVDMRLALEGSLVGWKYDKLLDLRLILESARYREYIHLNEHYSEQTDQRKRNVDPCRPTEKVIWWIDNNEIDVLKGLVWISGQQENSTIGVGHGSAR